MTATAAPLGSGTVQEAWDCQFNHMVRSPPTKGKLHIVSMHMTTVPMPSCNPPVASLRVSDWYKCTSSLEGQEPYLIPGAFCVL